MKPVPHPHGGHRARLRKRLADEGLAAFQPHEVVELLLYEAIPQRDVNPLAHRLIDQFGSVEGVLEADEAALCQVPGLGRRSSAYLRLMGEAARRYEALTMDDRPRIASAAQLARYCGERFHPGEGEQTWVFSLNKTGYLLGSALAAQGSRKPTLREAVEAALLCHGQAEILVFCRNPGDTQIRKTDLAFLKELAQQFARIRISLLDSVILAGRTFISLRRNGQYIAYAGDGLREPDTGAKALWAGWLKDD